MVRENFFQINKEYKCLFVFWDYNTGYCCLY